jgi:hypothetical protein
VVGREFGGGGDAFDGERRRARAEWNFELRHFNIPLPTVSECLKGELGAFGIHCFGGREPWLLGGESALCCLTMLSIVKGAEFLCYLPVVKSKAVGIGLSRCVGHGG